MELFKSKGKNFATICYVIVLFLYVIVYAIYAINAIYGEDTTEIEETEEGDSMFIAGLVIWFLTMVYVSYLSDFSKGSISIAFVLSWIALIVYGFSGTVDDNTGIFSLKYLSKDVDLTFSSPWDDVVTITDNPNLWYPTSYPITFSSLTYFLFYVVVVIGPFTPWVPFVIDLLKYKIIWVVFLSLAMPLTILLTNKFNAYGTKTEKDYISTLDLFTNFVRGTHKEWNFETYNVVDKFRLFIRLIILIGMYIGPIYWLISNKNWKTKEVLFWIILWIVGFPFILSKIFAHDCILSDDPNLIGGNNSYDDWIASNKEWELALHQHGGLFTIVTMVTITLAAIIYLH